MNNKLREQDENGMKKERNQQIWDTQLGQGCLALTLKPDWSPPSPQAVWGTRKQKDQHLTSNAKAPSGLICTLLTTSSTPRPHLNTQPDWLGTLF